MHFISYILLIYCKKGHNLFLFLMIEYKRLFYICNYKDYSININSK